MGLCIYEKVKELSLCDQRRILADLTESVEECMILDFETWLWLFWEEHLPKLRTQKKKFSLERKRWKIDFDRGKTMVKLLENSSSFSEYREKFYRFGLYFTNDIDIEGDISFTENVLGFDSDNKPLGYENYYIKGDVLYRCIANGYPLNINDGAVFKSKKKLKKKISKKNEILEVLLKFHKDVRAVTLRMEFVEDEEIIEYIDELYKIHGEDNLLFVITI